MTRVIFPSRTTLRNFEGAYFAPAPMLAAGEICDLEPEYISQPLRLQRVEVSLGRYRAVVSDSEKVA